MSDHTLRRADDLLTELVEVVETARAVPISGAAMVPREHTLDLLDDLREVLPPEMAEARRVMADRDGVLAAAHAEADALTTQSTAAARARTENADAAATARVAAAHEAAEAELAAAHDHAATTVAQAREEAARLISEGEAENARLVSSAGVHQAAAAAAEQLRADADAYHARVWADADQAAARVAQAAERYAADLRANAEDYVERTLAGAVDVLRRSALTADRGRAEVAARRAYATSVAEPATQDTAADQPGESTEPRSGHSEPQFGSDGWTSVSASTGGDGQPSAVFDVEAPIDEPGRDAEEQAR